MLHVEVACSIFAKSMHLPCSNTHLQTISNYNSYLVFADTRKVQEYKREEYSRTSYC
jgi:hypothetical protein